MIIKHENYIAQVEMDAKTGLFSGQIVNLSTPVTFMAKDAKGLQREFKRSINEYLKVCSERGIKPEKAYSGKFVLRTGPDLHRKAVLAAAQSGESLNNWLVDVISEKVG